MWEAAQQEEEGVRVPFSPSSLSRIPKTLTMADARTTTDAARAGCVDGCGEREDTVSQNQTKNQAAARHSVARAKRGVVLAGLARRCSLLLYHPQRALWLGVAAAVDGSRGGRQHEARGGGHRTLQPPVQRNLRGCPLSAHSRALSPHLTHPARGWRHAGKAGAGKGRHGGGRGWRGGKEKLTKRRPRCV